MQARTLQNQAANNEDNFASSSEDDGIDQEEEYKKFLAENQNLKDQAHCMSELNTISERDTEMSKIPTMSILPSTAYRLNAPQRSANNGQLQIPITSNNQLSADTAEVSPMYSPNIGAINARRILLKSSSLEQQANFAHFLNGANSAKVGTINKKIESKFSFEDGIAEDDKE